MFHGYTLVFPWLVLCPVCVAPVLAHCKLWLEWWLRDREWAGMTAEASFLSGSEQRQAGRSVKECCFGVFLPTEPAVCITSQHKRVSQTHNTSTTRPDQERENGRSGSFSAILNGFLLVYSSGIWDSSKFSWGERRLVNSPDWADCWCLWIWREF